MTRRSCLWAAELADWDTGTAEHRERSRRGVSRTLLSAPGVLLRLPGLLRLELWWSLRPYPWRGPGPFLRGGRPVILAKTWPQHCSHTVEQTVYGLEQTSDSDTTLMRFIHELRAPAASIYQTLDVVLQGYTDGSLGNQVEMLCLARDRARAMLGMINDCLRLGAVRQAEADTGKASVQLAEVLWKVLPAMRIKATVRGIELLVDVQEPLPLVGIAEEFAAQVLSNLIDNAIKYTHPGGQVVVCLKATGGFVTGTVEDTGIGIAPQDMSRIFDGFFRARNAKQIEPYGTGLGLCLVKCLVETHDGRIDVESEQGTGSKFTFSLPVVKGTRDAGGLPSNTVPGQ